MVEHIREVKYSDNKIFWKIYSKLVNLWASMHRVWLYVELVSLFLLGILRGIVPVVIVKQLGPTIVTTKYGKIRGSLVEFPKDSYIPLSPVEAYFGVKYGSLHNETLRFKWPASPNVSYRNIHTAKEFQPVCPQPHVGTKQLLKYLPEGSVEWRIRVTSFTKSQHEECLSCNLYVPMRGKLSLVSSFFPFFFSCLFFFVTF